MTDKAYYEKGFDIVSARERFFGKREMCERYVIRFLEDPNYEEMIKAIREKDTEQAFHYAHTLKGVCANLSLWRMQDAVSGVVEGLRLSKDRSMGKLSKRAGDYRFLVLKKQNKR